MIYGSAVQPIVAPKQLDMFWGQESFMDKRPVTLKKL